MKKGRLSHVSIFKNEGFTLVEVLASIVILSMIVIVSISFFIHSANTTKHASDKTTATYVAQEEIEYIQQLSNQNGFTAAIDLLKIEQDYQMIEQGSSYLFQKIDQSYTILSRITPQEGTDAQLIKILVQVMDEDGKPKAQMETKIEWEDEE